MGVGLSVMQVVTQVYLPSKVDRASSYYGAIGVAFAVLAWLFILGRLVVASAELDALVWARHGGLGGFIFDVLRFRSRTPRAVLPQTAVVAVTWNERYRAAEVAGAVATLRRSGVIAVDDLAVIEVDEDGHRFLLSTAEIGDDSSPARDGIGGLLAGVMLGMPVLGIATGLGAASVVAGIPPLHHQLAESFAAQLAPGHSALILIAPNPVDPVIDALTPFGGTMLVDRGDDNSVDAGPAGGTDDADDSTDDAAVDSPETPRG